MEDRRDIASLLVEESSREFDARLLIAADLVARDMDAIIAPQWSVWEALADLPSGVILFKGNNTAQAASMRAAQKNGHRVASIEEELLGVSDQGEVRRIYDPLAARYCDRFLVHGDHQKRSLEAIFARDCPAISVVGNPRIDLLRGRFGDEIRAAGQALKERFGRYILINTNFASINPRVQDSVAYLELCRAAGVTDPDDPSSMEDFFAWCAWEHENLGAIVSLAHALNVLSLPCRIIIRPHPSEKLTSWENAFRDVANVSIIREGDHLPWTAGAALMVHPGSTTGLGAAILGTPTMNLRCHDNQWHQMYLSTLVNPVFSDLDTAVQAIVDHVDGRDPIAAIREGGIAALRQNLHLDDAMLSARLVAGQLAELATASRGEGRREAFGQGCLGASDASDRKIDQSAFAESRVRARFEALSRRGAIDVEADIQTVSGSWVWIRPRHDREAA